MRLYNTLTGEDQEFVPAAGNTVKMYVCGVTPYSASHVGHAFSYVVFDVLRRYLEYLGYQVRHAQNFTDVDDKIIRRAREQGLSEVQLVDQYIAEFFRSMDALNVQRAHVYPRATQEIPRIVETIGCLVDKGYAYQAGGDVFFRVSRSEGYGKLSRRTLEGMIAGSRVQVDEAKEHPMDFVLWKGAKPGEPAWESPWGPGRPGWHIECTTMSMIYLGETLDIHGGGQDLVFPHHENEIAQSEAYSDKRPFVRFWVHNGLLRLGEDKMSKSLGNLVLVEEALRRYSADALRLYFLSSHYRSPLNYSDEGCAAMERSIERLCHALQPVPPSFSSPATEGEEVEVDSLAKPFQVLFLAAMDADLNTPKAIAVLFDLAHEINRAREAGQSVSQAQETLRRLGGILGLTFHGRGIDDGHRLTVKPFIELLLTARAELRRAKQYTLADHIREGLAQQGIVLEDTPQGTQWRYQRPE
jgi:cysteinyl-tRNA synthetase